MKPSTLILLILIIATSALPLKVFADEIDKSVDVIKISSSLYFFRISSAMGNTSSVAMIGPEGVFLIDPNFNDTDELIKNKIKELGGGKIKYLTSSHDHRDHIEQYGQFAEDVMIIIPNNQKEAVLEWGGNPQITFEGNLTITFNNQPIVLETLPTTIGHTDGDEIIYFPQAKALYVGDYYFATGFPIIDKNTGDIFGYIDNLDYIANKFAAETIVIPGHTTFSPEVMQIFTIKDLTKYANDLRASIEFIQRQLNNGQSLEQMQTLGLPEQFSKYDQGIKFRGSKKWIKRVVETIKK